MFNLMIQNKTRWMLSDKKEVELNKLMMIFFVKFPINTNFCHCRKGLICVETSLGIGA